MAIKNQFHDESKQRLLGEILGQFKEQKKSLSEIIINQLNNSFYSRVYLKFLKKQSTLTCNGGSDDSAKFGGLPFSEVMSYIEQSSTKKNVLDVIHRCIMNCFQAKQSKKAGSKPTECLCQNLNKNNANLNCLPQLYTFTWSHYEMIIKQLGLVNQFKSFLLQEYQSFDDQGFQKSRLELKEIKHYMLILLSYYRISQSESYLTFKQVWPLAFESQFPKNQVLKGKKRKNSQSPQKSLPFFDSSTSHHQISNPLISSDSSSSCSSSSFEEEQDQMKTEFLALWKQVVFVEDREHVIQEEELFDSMVVQFGAEHENSEHLFY